MGEGVWYARKGLKGYPEVSLVTRLPKYGQIIVRSDAMVVAPAAPMIPSRVMAKTKALVYAIIRSRGIQCLAGVRTL